MADDISVQILNLSATEEEAGRDVGNEEEPSMSERDWEQMEKRESDVRSWIDETPLARETPAFSSDLNSIASASSMPSLCFGTSARCCAREGTITKQRRRGMEDLETTREIRIFTAACANRMPIYLPV